MLLLGCALVRLCFSLVFLFFSVFVFCVFIFILFFCRQARIPVRICDYIRTCTPAGVTTAVRTGVAVAEGLKGR